MSEDKWEHRFVSSPCCFSVSCSGFPRCAVYIIGQCMHTYCTCAKAADDISENNSPRNKAERTRTRQRARMRTDDHCVLVRLQLWRTRNCRVPLISLLLFEDFHATYKRYRRGFADFVASAFYLCK